MHDAFSDSRAPATADQVTRDANLIARNFACLGRAEAVISTARHLSRFWAPLLRDTVMEQVRQHPERFSPIAREAISELLPLDTGTSRKDR